MLPSSYIRRLRTKDLINKNFPDRFPTQFSKKSTLTNRVDFSGTSFTHAYLPYLHRQKTQTMYSSPVSGQINLVLERLAEIQVKIQSTLVISNSKGLYEILRDIRTSIYQICRIEEKIIRTTIFNKYVCNWTFEVRYIENIVEKRRNCSLGAISPLFHNNFFTCC